MHHEKFLENQLKNLINQLESLDINHKIATKEYMAKKEILTEQIRTIERHLNNSKLKNNSKGE